jgi:UDPglucose 6-dehydrogenase
MAVGFIGLGKLGLPCALAVSSKLGETVYGFDLDNRIADFIESKSVPYLEAEVDEYFKSAQIKFCKDLDYLVQQTEIIFVAVQTPHEKSFEGTTPVPTEKKDFDYTYLESSIKSLCNSIKITGKKNVLITVISTVLPGTMRDRILPIIESVKDLGVEFCYNPFFIAMGTTISDFLNPEFVLIGSNNPDSSRRLENFYSKFLSAPTQNMSIESAELTKVAYNTFIGFKIVFANTIAEICAVRGGDSDQITQALAKAGTRLMSPKYLSAGMADGGGCHPRDQIAMSWLAQDANLSTDLFGYLARARDAQTNKQASLILEHSKLNKLPIVILGKSYKADINLTVGSPALLLAHFLINLKAEFTHYDPTIDEENPPLDKPACYFIATNHTVFKSYRFPNKSIVIDPWGNVVENQANITVVRPGRATK